MKKKLELPADISGLDLEGLSALSDQILDRYGELKAIDTPSKDEVAEIKELGTALKAVRDRKAELEAEAAADEEALEAARAELEKEPAEDPDEEDEDEDDEPSDEPVEEKVEPEPVLASGKKVKGAGAAAAAKAKTPVAPEPEDAPGAVITAAAEVKGFSAGQVLEGMKDLTKAFTARATSIPTSVKGGRVDQYAVARMHKPRPEGLVQIAASDSGATAFEKLLGVSKAARNASYDGLQAITAAAIGWVTPSENLYDLCSWATLDGLLTLPSIGVERGGINFVDPSSLDYDVIFGDADGSFTYTEAQLEANPTKPLLELETPEWEDERLDVFGWGIKLPIPLRTSFPELIEWYLENAAVAYGHKKNANKIQRVLSHLGTAVDFTEHGSAASDLLEAIEVAVLATRYKYRLAENATVVGMAPRWIKSAIRIDLSRRNGYASPFDVTDAQIESWFRARGIQFQYVVDWAGQDLAGDAKVLPSTLDFGLWVPGTFVEGGDDIFDISAVYDSAGIVKNEFIGAFFEESLLVANICGEGRRETVGLNYFGLSGAPIIGSADS